MPKIHKILIIGPVYPFKGGISHYTGLLGRALSQKYNVEIISFKMQYPKALFRKQQKDYSNDRFKFGNVNYLIHTANPFNWLKVSRYIKKANPDLVIIQWWHPYFAPCFWSICKLTSCIHKLFICHNVYPHERFLMDKILTKATLKNGKYFIVHSKLDAQDLINIKKDVNYVHTYIPTYSTFKIKNLSKNRARIMLNKATSQKILLFFGLIREYKGLRYLIEAAPEIVSKLDNITIMIVGDFDGEKEKYEELIYKTKMEANIEIIDQYISDGDVEMYFSACDLVVLPYISATQSGIVQVAYGFNKPVVSTNVGGLPEVVIDDKTGFVVPARNPSKLAEVIIRYFKEEKEEEFVENIKDRAYLYSWDRMVDIIAKLCESK